MIMTRVCSTNLCSVGYEHNTLYVHFNSGSTYVYDGVPQYEYENLMSASSHGRYFCNNIKGKYPYRRID